MSDALKQQIANMFDVDPDLLQPTREQVQLKIDQEAYAERVRRHHQELAASVRFAALLPPGMTWVVE